MIHFLNWRDGQEIKAEVFNYQQINKMETINSIRQFLTREARYGYKKQRSYKSDILP